MKEAAKKIALAVILAGASYKCLGSVPNDAALVNAYTYTDNPTNVKKIVTKRKTCFKAYNPAIYGKKDEEISCTLNF